MLEKAADELFGREGAVLTATSKNSNGIHFTGVVGYFGMNRFSYILADFFAAMPLDMRRGFATPIAPYEWLRLCRCFAQDETTAA